MVRTMFKSKNRPKDQLAEAVGCTINLSNDTHTRNLKDVIPQEVCSGWKPCASHIVVLAPLLICIFWSKKDLSMKIKLGSLSSTAIMRSQKTTSCLIQAFQRFWLAEMFNSLKKHHVFWELTWNNLMIFFHILKKKKKMRRRRR